MKSSEYKHPEIKIAERLIGEKYPPAVIVEIGINHAGSLDTAIKMVDAAIDNGAEIIKHQTHIINDEMSHEAQQIIPKNADTSIYNIMKECALSEADEKILMEYVLSKNVIFISTPFSRAAVDRLVKFNIPAFKIGSGECNNYPLIKYIASFRKPVIVSTGMNSIESIKKTVQILQNFQTPYALLHCTNVYPTPPELVRLGAINELMREFPEAVVGLSDHTTSNYPCLGAVALGASILERHFTDSMDRIGPDIICSMDGDSLRQLIEGSLIIYKARGGNKHKVKEEESTIAFAFASVVSIKNIKKGDILGEDNIWVMRPGGGDFSANDFESLLGKVAAKDIREYSQIKFSDIT